jgi:hypothetical protein
MNPLDALVSDRACHRSEYCRAPEAIFKCAFEVEHITPESRDGTNDESNLALACRVCNLRKLAHVAGTDPQTGLEIPLFHPRTDLFDEHFQISLETGTMTGITPTGRATVARLDLNSEAQTRALLQWIRLGIFP